MKRVMVCLVIVLLLGIPAPVSNQNEPANFKPWQGQDMPAPLQWYCTDPAPHAMVEETVFCDGGWIKGRCSQGLRAVRYDPESPARVCGWFTFLMNVRSQ